MMLNTPLLSGVTKAIFRIVFILPWLFTIAVIAVIWRLLLDPSGVVNYVLNTVGLLQQGVDWLGRPGHGALGGDLHQHLVRLPVLHDQPARRPAGHLRPTCTRRPPWTGRAGSSSSCT